MTEKYPVTTTRLLFAIRDSKATKHAARQLLDALALRGNHKTPSFVSWPSYATLVEDTGLSLPTLQKAAKALEDSKYIYRKIRVNRPNLWQINVALILELADKAIAERKAKKLEMNLADECPFHDDREHQEGNDSDVCNEGDAIDGDDQTWDLSGGAR